MKTLRVLNEETGEMEDIEVKPSTITNIVPKIMKRGRPRNDGAKYKQNDYNDYQKQYAKEYYQKKNKEKMLSSMKTKYMCNICCATVSKTNMVPHQKTIRCQAAKNKPVLCTCDICGENSIDWKDFDSHHLACREKQEKENIEKYIAESLVSAHV
jgi:hypothetical protein